MKVLKGIFKGVCYLTVAVNLMLFVTMWSTFCATVGLSLGCALLGGLGVCVVILILGYWTRALFNAVVEDYRHNKEMKRVTDALTWYPKRTDAERVRDRRYQREIEQAIAKRKRSEEAKKLAIEVPDTGKVEWAYGNK